MADYIVACMQEGNLCEIRKYIKERGDTNEYTYSDDENNLTLLHLAAGLDSIHRESVIELLIDSKADLNYPGISENVESVRPLHLAAMWGYEMTVKLLLYHGADPSLRDSNDLSPVDYASIFDNYQCISLLIKYGSLNSTASAWSAIMDSSLGDSIGAEDADSNITNYDESDGNNNSSIRTEDNCLYTTALEPPPTPVGPKAPPRLVKNKLFNLSGDSGKNGSSISKLVSETASITLNSSSESSKIDNTSQRTHATTILISDTTCSSIAPVAPIRKKKLAKQKLLKRASDVDIDCIELLRTSVDDSATSKSENQNEIVHSETQNETHYIKDDDHDPLDSIKEDEINMSMDNQTLRLRLRCLGKTPGPITDTTKRLYAKLLVRLMKEDKELVLCSPKTKTSSEINGRSVELNSIMTGKFPLKQALELEKEFLRISNTKAYHGPKLFFNYILIDPRISKNIPEQAIDFMSDSETSGSRLCSPEVGDNQTGSVYNPSKESKGTYDRKHYSMGRMNSSRKFNPQLFDRFLKSIFYIGKGQKKRDLMHLYDALADRNSITQKKINRIRSIWSDGYGVVSLHLFHNITSKEALTREALMIESVSLSNLTNLLKGTIQFKLGWNEHKRQLLGALLIYRAYVQFLNEGERQLRREDLRAPN